MTRPQFVRIACIVGSLVGLGTLFALSSSCRQSTQTSRTIRGSQAAVLEPGRVIERRILPGDTHVYRLDLSGNRAAEGHFKVSAEQLGIDIELILAPKRGDRRVTDSPLDRAGSESILVGPGVSDSLRVEVYARERIAPPGSYRITLEALPDDSVIAGRRLAAEMARQRAAQAYAEGAAGRPAALEYYRLAAARWREVGDDDAETRDLYCAAVLQRLIGETRSALQSARDVLPRWQRLNDRYWQATTHNEIGLLLWRLEKSEEARAQFELARAVKRDLGDVIGAAKAGSNICLTNFTEGRLRDGLSCYQPLLETLDSVNEPQLIANILTNIGWANDNLGEPDAAFDAYHRALALRRQAGDRQGIARTLNNLALLHQRLGEFEHALAKFDQALTLITEFRDRRWQGQVLNNIGFLYAILGEYRRALVFLRESLSLHREVEDRRREVWTLTNIAMARQGLGEHKAALSRYQEALELAKTVGDPRLEAMTETTIGLAKLKIGDADQALEHGTRALERLDTSQARLAEADALELIGKAQRLGGDPQSAAQTLETSLSLMREARSHKDQAGLLTALAQARRDLGQLGQARETIEMALASTESLRRRVDIDEVRAQFQKSRLSAHRFHIDLLMTLHRQNPGAGHDLEALTASEQMRAQALLDLLREAGADLHHGVAPELIERRRAAGRRLQAKSLRRSMMIADQVPPEEQEEAERELSSALFEFDRIEAESRRSAARYADLTRSEPLRVSDMQALLDADTALLEFALGDQRSFLWLITQERIHSFELPDSQEIEELALQFHRLIKQPGAEDRRAQSEVAAKLSEFLLAPVWPHIEAERLVVIPDGALHYLPFAALPIPSASSAPLSIPQPLLTEHEIVYWHSATVLAEQRRRRSGRKPPQGKLAMVADPVFERNDPRLSSVTTHRTATSSTLRQQNETRPSSTTTWQRLVGSRREAEAILDLAPPGPSLSAIGFKANRTTILEGELSQYRIIHFATHGLIDTDVPRLSGLALSFFDPAGRAREGFLRSHEIFNLDLHADLVVLSGCETALGREVRGEGLMGLTRGFIYAGSARVVASLWQVEDRATAELMSRFYRSMWLEGASPAAALRAAQLSILEEMRWQDPYYWSAFVMQGDW